MKNGARKAGVLCGAAFASTLLGATMATQAAAQSSTLMIGGIYTPSLNKAVMGSVLGGRFSDQELISVQWPAKAWPFTGLFSQSLSTSVDVGVENLTKQLDLAIDRLSKDADGDYLPTEKVTVVGLSAGSLVVDAVMGNLAADTGASVRDIVEFYTVENTTLQRPYPVYNPFINYTFEPQPETPYDVVNVTGEYDGFADYPQRWWNALAVANALAGEIFVHIPVMFDNLDTADKTVTVTKNDQGGTTTTYFVRAARLPLVRVFPFLRPFESQLRAIIDAGYTRNDPDIDQTGTEDAAAVAADTGSGEQEVAPGDGDRQSADAEAGAADDGSEGGSEGDADADAGDAVGAPTGHVSGGDDTDARTEADARTEEEVADQSEQAVADEVTETEATEAETDATEAEAESDGADGAAQTEPGGASAEAADESGTDGGPAADADVAESESAAAQ